MAAGAAAGAPLQAKEVAHTEEMACQRRGVHLQWTWEPWESEEMRPQAAHDSNGHQQGCNCRQILPPEQRQGAGWQLGAHTDAWWEDTTVPGDKASGRVAVAPPARANARR